jgi:uncharacterized protein YlzI (FlbEa/FlbD family)
VKLLKIKVNELNGVPFSEAAWQAIPHDRIERVLQSGQGTAIIVLNGERIVTESSYSDVIERLAWHEQGEVDLRRAQVQLTKDLSVLAKAATKYFEYREYGAPTKVLATAIDEFPSSTEFRALVLAIEKIADKFNSFNTNEQ